MGEKIGTQRPQEGKRKEAEGGRGNLREGGIKIDGSN
jgi:hypothetical protein